MNNSELDVKTGCSMNVIVKYWLDQRILSLNFVGVNSFLLARACELIVCLLVFNYTGIHDGNTTRLCFMFAT